MLPYTELDNYKLQVELLHEKLQRSEENRKKLEHKLEHAIQKKSEQEKIVRAKQREKYQDFLSELEKRNERNRQLMKMLERVDQQTAALSARSERLKMMKMQYEMYFAKLVQTQTMRCIQATAPTAVSPATFLRTAPTPIPVLLPTTPPTQQHQQHQQSTVMTPTPIKNNEHEPLTSAGPNEAAATTTARTAPTASAIYQCDASGNLIAAGAASTPAMYMPTAALAHGHIANASGCNTITTQPTATTLPALAASTQHWTLALATPTPAGMLLTNNNTTPMPAAANLNATDYVTTAPTFDYMQYPLGYLPRMRHLLQQKPNMSIYSDESDDLLLPATRANTKSDRYRRHRSNMDNDNDMHTHVDDDYDDTNDEPINDGMMDAAREIGALNRMDLPTRQLDNDKNSEVRAAAQQQQQMLPRRKDNERQGTELPLSGMSPTSSASLLTLDKLPKTMTMTEHNDTAFAASTTIDERNNDVDDGSSANKAKVETRFDEFSKGISSTIGDVDKGKGALPIQRNEEEKKLANATSAVVTVPTTISTTTTSAVISNDNGSFIEANLRQKIDTSKPWQQQHLKQSWHQAESTANSTETTSGGNDKTLRYDEMTAGFTENAQNSAANDDGGSKANNDGTSPAKMSIEKIENEIYGELVTLPTSETGNAAIARNAAQGLVSELVTQQQQQELPQGNMETHETAAVDLNISSTANDQSNSESYDPNYATIEGTTNAEVYATQAAENASEYAQYATDPNADYTNVDYANYDATQYAADGTYDPNIYPGYTYDEATGQYTADPNYLVADGTVGYDAQATTAYEQQQYDPSQQAQNYDYTNYEQATENVSNLAYNETDAAALAAAVTPGEHAQSETPIAASSNTELPDLAITPTPASTIMSNANKPASILSSGDKHAANEAQKKKKRVNFVDSSETDDSSSVKQAAAPSGAGGAANESDFDFSSDKSDKSGTT